jgi:hypothetical protein
MKKMDTQFQTPQNKHPKEPDKAHKNMLKEEILQDITRISWRCY